jgi:hypothetical protein
MGSKNTVKRYSWWLSSSDFADRAATLMQFSIAHTCDTSEGIGGLVAAAAAWRAAARACAGRLAVRLRCGTACTEHGKLQRVLPALAFRAGNLGALRHHELLVLRPAIIANVFVDRHRWFSSPSEDYGRDRRPNTITRTHSYQKSNCPGFHRGSRKFHLRR